MQLSVMTISALKHIQMLTINFEKKIEKIEKKSSHWLYYFTWVFSTAMQENEGQRSTVYRQDLWEERLDFVITS